MTKIMIVSCYNKIYEFSFSDKTWETYDVLLKPIYTQRINTYYVPPKKKVISYAIKEKYFYNMKYKSIIIIHQ